jgi:ubiquinone/menaquinone biosynthesis C-methylase UbiE
LNRDPDRAILRAARLPSWGVVHRRRLRAALGYAGASVLDVGCSSGGYVNALRARGYRAVGLDLLADPMWLDNEECPYVAGNASALPFADATFDTVLAFEILEHLREPALALAEFRRVACTNVILSVPDCETPEGLLKSGLTFAHWRDRTHRTFFTEGSLLDMLRLSGYRPMFTERIIPVLVDYPVLRSFGVPPRMAFGLARLFNRIPFRAHYGMTLLVVAERVG